MMVKKKEHEVALTYSAYPERRGFVHLLKLSFQKGASHSVDITVDTEQAPVWLWKEYFAAARRF